MGHLHDALYLLATQGRRQPLVRLQVRLLGNRLHEADLVDAGLDEAFSYLARLFHF
jgi:hypothetical protein